MRKPNFFIIGAPKCGTTAMNDYLAQHPQIFMATKEILYFGLDLKVSSRLSLPKYLQAFEKAKNETIVGEASVWYLFSESAAAEIKTFSPNAKILMMLRNPVQVIHSLHSQHLYDGNEDVLHFETAVRLDAERKQGRHLPRSVDYTQLPPYIDSVLFSAQVERYLHFFSRENIKIILYDDFVENTMETMRETFRFLGVDPNVTIDIAVVNPNKEIRSFTLHRFIKKPSAIAKKIVRVVMPFKKVRHALMHYFLEKNSITKKRVTMRTAFEQQLKARVAPDIMALSKLIDRDLSKWLQ